MPRLSEPARPIVDQYKCFAISMRSGWFIDNQTSLPIIINSITMLMCTQSSSNAPLLIDKCIIKNPIWDLHQDRNHHVARPEGTCLRTLRFHLNSLSLVVKACQVDCIFALDSWISDVEWALASGKYFKTELLTVSWRLSKSRTGESLRPITLMWHTLQKEKRKQSKTWACFTKRNTNLN